MRLKLSTLAAIGLLALPAAGFAQPAAAPAPATTAAPPAAAAPAGQSARSGRVTAPVPAMAPVNINTATAAELDKLPQIGEKRAAAIIKNRPYKTTDELVSKKAISKGIFEKIKDKITV